MLEHLGQTVRKMRRDQGVKLVMIGAALNKSEAALSRFESGKSWPQDVDAVVSAYASELGIDPTEIWEGAIQRWLHHSKKSAA